MTTATATAEGIEGYRDYLVRDGEADLLNRRLARQKSSSPISSPALSPRRCRSTGTPSCAISIAASPRTACLSRCTGC